MYDIYIKVIVLKLIYSMQIGVPRKRALCIKKNCQLSSCVPSPLSKGGGEPKFWKFQKRGGTWKKNWGGETKRRWKIFKNKGGTQLFKLNLGIEKNKNEEF